MRIGVDAVPFAFERTGVARYLGSVLDEMLAVDPASEFLLYTPIPVSVPLRSGNWQLRLVPDRLALRPSVWVQTTLPGLLASDKVDAFWGQPTNLPLRPKHKCFQMLTVHDLVPYVVPDSMRFRSWLRMRIMLGLTARAADAVIADSWATAALARRYLGIDMERLHVVHAAAQGMFRPVPRDQARAALMDEFGLPRSYILFVSTIEPRKDHLTLLRAIARVPHAPLLVLAGGVGWRCNSILREIRVAEDAGRVKYVGRVDDDWLPALYSAATISVYPSVYEGFGLPVLEAMSCGCPVLCSDSSSLPEVGGDAACYFRTGDSEDLARRLTELLDDGDRLDAMSAAGLNQANRFSFRTAAEEILGIIRRGVAPSRRGPGR
ncbi:MAG: glycosyltransferase family 1 protein [candidate division WOR-3 bacterium]|nr:glycosyltransferase family 1 protein [candidate division WOR-3 bacterium]